MKRLFAVFAVILVLTSCVSVPSSAIFAAGVDADGYTLIEVPYRPLYTHDDGGNVIRNLTYDDFMNGGVLYEYQGSSAYGCSLYTYGQVERTAPAYGAMLKGSVLNSYLSGYDDDLYYTIAISRVSGWIGSIVRSGTTYYNYNSYTVGALSDLGRIVHGYPQNASDDDYLFYFGIMSNQRYSREIIAQHEEFECCTSLFDSWDQLMSALDRAEQSPSPSPVAGSVSITIPAGHVAVIKSSNFDIVGRTTQVIAGNASEGMPYTNQLYGYFTSLPSQFNQNSFAYGMMWTPVGPFDSSGWTKSARWEESKGSIGVDSEPYIAICNPMYCFSRGRDDPYFMTLNNSVYLTVTGVIEQIWDVPLRTYITQAAGSAAQAAGNSDPGVIYEGVWDSSTPGSPVTYQNSEGETFTPQSGGLTATDPETDFFGSISSAFESFTSIFTWGHNAVRSIISGSRDFFAAFTSIFSWMPSEVLSVLSACLILILVIGVVKVLL